MAEQSQPDGRHHAGAYIALGLILTTLGIVWAVARHGVAIPMLTGPACLIYGFTRLARRG
jgi:hypothetical protein